MGSFSDFKKKSRNTVDILEKKLGELNKPTFQRDERIWVPQKDAKTGNGFAIIRFLPAPDGEDAPFVRYFSHGFKGPGGSWYIENCPTTIGKPCPCCIQNSVLWNSGLDANKEIARSRKRKEIYVSNILVIKDPANESNEGKVFIFQYGKKIFEKINACMHPQFPGEEKVDPFNAWEGKDFKLKIKTVLKYSNYDESSFSENKSPIAASDSEIEKIWRKQYPLMPFVDPSSFKSPEELQKRYDEVMGGSAPQGAQTTQNFAPRTNSTQTKIIQVQEEAPFEEDSDDNSALNLFRKLSEEE